MANTPRQKKSIVTAGDRKTVHHRMFLIYGDSGTGKTTMGAKSVPEDQGERVLIGLTEWSNGMESIKAANPQAQCYHIADLNDVDDFLTMVETEVALAENEGRPTKWDWFVIDSMTDLGDIVQKTITKMNGGEPDWAVIVDRIKNIIRRVRDVRMNKIVICLQKTIYPDDKNTLDMIKVEQSLIGKVLPNKIMSMSNICGWVFRGKESGDFRVMFRGPRNFAVKGHPNLDDLEVPNIRTWVPKISAPVDPDKFKEYADGYMIDDEGTDQETKEDDEKSDTEE